MHCETCNYYIYDEDFESYVCDVNMDEDDYVRWISGDRKVCPYYRNADEYLIVRKQK